MCAQKCWEFFGAVPGCVLPSTAFCLWYLFRSALQSGRWEFNPFYFSTHHGALLDAFDAIDFDVDFWRRRGSQMSLEPDRSGYQSYAYSYALPARAPTDVVHYYVRK